MNKKTKWKIATGVVTGFLLLALNPEIRLFALLIDAVGLDIFFMLLQAQILVVVGTFYHQRVMPIFYLINRAIEKVDPYYFSPNIVLIRKCPAVVVHSVPFLFMAHLVFLGAVASNT